MDHPLFDMMDGDDGLHAPHADIRSSAHGSSGSGSGSGAGDGHSGVLQELLALCGVSSAPRPPSARSTPLTLAHPPHRVRQLLESELPRNSERAAQFVAEMTERCGEVEHIRRLLLPTTDQSLSSLPRPQQLRAASQQDSVIRICLNVLSLQRPLIDWLLEQLVLNEDDWLSADGIRTSILSQRGPAQSLPAGSLPRLLIDQLRLLDVVYDSDALCSKLQEVIEALSTVKAELITALPDILLDPCYHDKMAECLIAQLRVSEALLLPVLDCLSRLHLTSRQKERAVGAVQPLVASVKEMSLPALIRFLLQMTSDDSVTDILDTIRLHLPQLAHDHSSDSDSAGGKGGKEEREQEVSGSVLIVDALRSGLQQNQLACKAFLELLRADERSYKAADVLLLFVIHGLPHNKQLSQRAVDVLCKKLLAGSIPSALLHSSIANHVGCVRPMFDSVAALAERMVRKNVDRAVREAGGAMQVDLFSAFDDRAQRMAIVQSWLQQLGSREPAEMDSALHSLQAVGRTKDGVRALAVFFEYLKTVLQYLDDYKLPQIRALFQLLASLAFKRDAVAARAGRVGDHDGGRGADGGGCHPFDTSLQVFVQKELYAPSLRDQRIGIVAVVALMQPIAASSPQTEQRFDSQLEQRGGLPDSLCVLLDQLFESLVKCTRRSPSAQSFLYDELSLALDSHRLLHGEVLSRVHRYFISTYQPHLLVPRAHGKHPLPLTVDGQTVQLNCEDQLAGPEMTANKAKCSFNIAPTLLQPSPDRQLMTLPAELRLLAACYRADRPADGFVQLLIAPFTLPAPVGRNHTARVDHFEQQTPYVQRVWLSSHFHAIQCLREIINAFSSPSLRLDSSDRDHLAPCLVHRMQQLLSAEDQLRAMLKRTPDFTAQQLLSMADSTEERLTREMGTLNGTMKADESHLYTVLNGKVHVTKKKKKANSDTDDSDSERRRKKKKQQASPKKAKESTAEASEDDRGGPFDVAVRPLLRPLTIHCVQLLCNPISKNILLAAEAHRRNEQAKKRASKQHPNEGDEHHSNPLLLYLSPAEIAQRSLPHLSVRVLRHLMAELHRKMEAVLGAASSHNTVSHFPSKDSLPAVLVPSFSAADTPISLLAVLAPVLRGVHDHWLVLNEFLSTSDEDDDMDISRDELTACLIACVHVVRLIVDCPTLTAHAHWPTLRSTMVELIGAVREKSGSVAQLSQISEQSLPTLCELLISRLRSNLGSFRCIDEAVAVVAVVQSIDSLCSRIAAEEQQPGSQPPLKSKRLHDIAHKLLSREWTTAVVVRKHNVGELVALLVQHADDSWAIMSSIAPRMLALAVTKKNNKKKQQSGAEDEEDGAEDDTEQGCPSRPLYKQLLTKQTVPLWLLPMVECSSRLLGTIDLNKPGTRHLEQMQQLVQLAADLLDIAKQYPRQVTLHKHCIKLALRMLDSFTRGLGGMGKMLQHSGRQRIEPAVKQTLSGMQKVTRAFTALCVHVKEQQVASLLTIMPKAKMAYERWCIQPATHALSAHEHTDATAAPALPSQSSIVKHLAVSLTG